MSAVIDLSPLQRAPGMLEEALLFWQQPDGTPLQPHLRSAVIQSFGFSYELSIRRLRRVLVERAPAAAAVIDLSFNDLLRAGADAGLLPDALSWRAWRELRNATSHAYDETRAQQVASDAQRFVADAAALLAALRQALPT